MTVVTLGGRHTTQLGNFAVERLEVRLRDLLVTAAALVHDAQPEIGKIGALDAVGGVAIGANRQRLPAFGDVRAMDAGGKQLVDAAVAFRAGFGDVGAVHAGAWVAGGQFVVRGVAVGAIGGDGKTGLQESCAVDALAVMFHDMVLFAGVANGGLVSLLVAVGAEGGDVSRKGRRGGVDPA